MKQLRPNSFAASQVNHKLTNYFQYSKTNAIYELVYYAGTEIVLGPAFNKHNEKLYLFSFTDANIESYTNDNYTIDLSLTGLNGRIDGYSTLEADDKFILWAFANRACTELEGFGLSRVPIEDITLIFPNNAAKGSTEVFVQLLNNYAFLFPVGSTCIIEAKDNPIWNYCIIEEIVSVNAINVTLLNQDFDYYNQAIDYTSGNYTIRLVNNFKPLVAASELSFFRNHYLAIAEFQITKENSLLIEKESLSNTGLYKDLIERNFILTNDYSNSSLNVDFYFNFTGNLFDVISSKSGTGKEFVTFPFDINKQRYIYREDNFNWTIDLDSNSIDLDNKIGGYLGGFPLINDRWYLIWAFLNHDYSFAGLGCTLKPIDDIADIDNGNKGALTGIGLVAGLAYNFSVGARVCIRNDFNWNWGTIIQIYDNNDIQVQLDNNSYGTDFEIRGNDKILQWDTFRPKNTSGNLIYPYYSLIGELYRYSSYVWKIYKKNEEYRILFGDKRYISTTSTFSQSGLSLGKFIPLWAEKVGILVSITGSAGKQYIVYNYSNLAHDILEKEGSTIFLSRGMQEIPLRDQALIGHSSTGVQTIGDITYYKVSGGMRG